MQPHVYVSGTFYIDLSGVEDKAVMVDTCKSSNLECRGGRGDEIKRFGLRMPFERLEPF